MSNYEIVLAKIKSLMHKVGLHSEADELLEALQQYNRGIEARLQKLEGADIPNVSKKQYW